MKKHDSSRMAAPDGHSAAGGAAPSGVQPPDSAFAAARGRIYGSIVETVGGTPLVALPRLCREDGLLADLALKLEFFNPLGSVKDRIGAAMLLRAEREGHIIPGRTVLVEPTSGMVTISR